MSEQAQSLVEMLGFDPTKSEKIDSSVLEEALKEVREEQTEVAKKRAKELFVKAMEISKNMAKARKDFEKEEKKFNQSLGKLLNQLKGREEKKEDKDKKDE